MKVKILMICLLFFMSVGPVSAAEEDAEGNEVVKVYVFWRDGCSYCEALIEGLNEIEEEYLEYFEIVTIDVYGGSNGDLYDYISTELGDSGYVPYTVVGSQHVSGYNLDGIIEAALEEYANEDYYDIIEAYTSVVSGYDLEDLEYACDYKGIDYWNATEKESSVGDYIAVGAVILASCGLVYLVFIPKKI